MKSEKSMRKAKSGRSTTTAESNGSLKASRLARTSLCRMPSLTLLLQQLMQSPSQPHTVLYRRCTDLRYLCESNRKRHQEDEPSISPAQADVAMWNLYLRRKRSCLPPLRLKCSSVIRRRPPKGPRISAHCDPQHTDPSYHALSVARRKISAVIDRLRSFRAAAARARDRELWMSLFGVLKRVTEMYSLSLANTFNSRVVASSAQLCREVADELRHAVWPDESMSVREWLDINWVRYSRWRRRVVRVERERRRNRRRRSS